MRRALRPALVGAVMLTTVGLLPRDAAAETPACTTPKTTCAGHSGYYASSDDINRLTAVADPILRDIRTCLDGSGAKHVPSVLVIRWDSDGKPVDVKIDVPGYESLPCVQKAQTKLSTLQNPHETTIRCEFGCAKPPPPPPPPAPVVVPPPAAVTQPPATQPPATQPAPVAQPAPAAVAPEKRYEKVWYGYQPLIADGISSSLFLGGLASKTSGLTTAGYLGFILGTPILHMAHGNVGRGFGSLAIRIFAPLTTAGIGAIAGAMIGGTDGSGKASAILDGNANGTITGAVVGSVIGVAGCVLIDAAGFAYTKELVDERAITQGPPRRQQAAFTLAPSVDIQKERTTVGVVGRF